MDDTAAGNGRQQNGFATAGLTAVLLPSGYRVRGVVPSFQELARAGLLDIRVLAAAARLADAEWLKASTDDAKEDNLRAVIDAKVAAFPRQALDPGSDTWQPVHLTVDDLPNIDQRDRDRLEELVMRVFTAEQITAAVERGDFDLAGQASALDSLAEFRGDDGGPPDSDHGPVVAGAPVGAPAGAG